MTPEELALLQTLIAYGIPEDQAMQMMLSGAMSAPVATEPPPIYGPSIPPMYGPPVLGEGRIDTNPNLHSGGYGPSPFSMDSYADQFYPEHLLQGAPLMSMGASPQWSALRSTFDQFGQDEDKERSVGSTRPADVVQMLMTAGRKAASQRGTGGVSAASPAARTMYSPPRGAPSAPSGGGRAPAPAPRANTAPAPKPPAAPKPVQNKVTPGKGVASSPAVRSMTRAKSR